MKRKLSVTVEEGTVAKLDDVVRDGRFRNKSHLVEFALNKFLREDNDTRKD